ncbi:MAG TPA: ABC transporter ATP-binding protein [Spirochaetia bacterium]|nr:ABC transporter ATP-binding protein [Spirochaetia bacterium]
MADTLLELREITKQFPGVIANDHVSFDLRAGEVHALVGENGAGKTTLMKILYGLYRPDSGTISVEGSAVSVRGPRDAISRGIGMVHQHFMLFPPFSVLENIVIGEESHHAGVLATGTQRARVQSIMQENGITVPVDARVEELAVGLQQRVEILKILFRGAKILIFDEPTAVLTPQESAELFRTFRALTSHGKGVIFITHKLDEVLAVADRITVIRQGKVVRTMDRAGVTKPMIAELMVGKPVLMEVERPAREAGATVLEVRDLKVRSPRGLAAVDGISFSVKAGEIYGIAGVEGNGQSELVHAIAEGVEIESGEILLDGSDTRKWSVRKRRENGITHIPEDRLKYGLLLPFSIATNLTLGRHDKPPFATRLQTVNQRAIRESARRIIRQFDIRTPSENTPANALSGGNQQKAVVARELAADPRLLVASQPTRGVDIGATEFIHRQIMKARTEGKAVLLVSADLDELLSLSDRIGVIFKGRIIREFTHAEAVREEVGLAMTGGKAGEERAG